MPFKFKSLDIPDVILIEPVIFNDHRGFFMETYKRSEFYKNGISFEFVQDNHSKSSRGILRGLHYQLNPKAQGKLVRCIRGRIWDVAVDIRRGSPWFGEWVGIELSEENKRMLWVPPGFAHGFLSLEDGTEVLYKVTSEFSPDLERGIAWNDPSLGINWPVKNPVLSEKDSKLPNLSEAENNFVYEVKN